MAEVWGGRDGPVEGWVLGVDLGTSFTSVVGGMGPGRG